MLSKVEASKGVYFYVRLIPRDFGSLAYGHYPSASQKPLFRQSQRNALDGKSEEYGEKTGIYHQNRSASGEI
jgi:hypothetical protein